MEEKAYHIEIYPSHIFWIRDKFSINGINAMIEEGGIQFYADNSKLKIAQSIADDCNLKIKDGLLPTVIKKNSNLLGKLITMLNGSKVNNA